MTKILQIEDNLANKILIERVLERFDYELLHAEDGNSGFSLAVETNPDLILVDMGLPDIDGQTIVTMMRQIPDLAQTPIVAITAWPPDTAIEMAKRYGCDGCIVKPINVETFHDELQRYLNPNKELP